MDQSVSVHLSAVSLGQKETTTIKEKQETVKEKKEKEKEKKQETMRRRAHGQEGEASDRARRERTRKNKDKKNARRRAEEAGTQPKAIPTSACISIADALPWLANPFGALFFLTINVNEVGALVGKDDVEFALV